MAADFDAIVISVGISGFYQLYKLRDDRCIHKGTAAAVSATPTDRHRKRKHEPISERADAMAHRHLYRSLPTAEPMVRRLTAGGKWIRTSSSAPNSNALRRPRWVRSTVGSVIGAAAAAITALQIPTAGEPPVADDESTRQVCRRMPSITSTATP